MLSTAHYRRLEAKINEKRSVIAESITDGACTSYEHYRDMCGYMRALNDVVIMCEEIEAGDNA